MNFDRTKTNTVNIVGFPYRVVVKEKVFNHNNETIEGCWNPDEATITISKAPTPDMMNETLLHEILHGIADATYSELTEEMVHRISRALYACGVRPPIAFTKADCNCKEK